MDPEQGLLDTGRELRGCLGQSIPPLLVAFVLDPLGLLLTLVRELLIKPCRFLLAIEPGNEERGGTCERARTERDQNRLPARESREHHLQMIAGRGGHVPTSHLAQRTAVGLA